MQLAKTAAERPNGDVRDMCGWAPLWRLAVCFLFSVAALTACDLVRAPTVPNTTAATADPLPENSLADALQKHGLNYVTGLAERGNAKAQYFLSEAYFKGAPGIVRSDAQGYLWRLRSANRGASLAQAMMGGYWYETARSAGNNLVKFNINLTRSIAWFMVAEANGFKPATEELQRLEQIFMNGKPQTNFREDVWQPAQTTAANWRLCQEKSCVDHDLKVIPPAQCIESPISLMCLGYE